MLFTIICICNRQHSMALMGKNVQRRERERDRAKQSIWFFFFFVQKNNEKRSMHFQWFIQVNGINMTGCDTTIQCVLLVYMSCAPCGFVGRHTHNFAWMTRWFMEGNLLIKISGEAANCILQNAQSIFISSFICYFWFKDLCVRTTQDDDHNDEDGTSDSTWML